MAKKVAERRKEKADPLVSDIPKRVGRKREIEAGKYDIAPGLLVCVWRRGWREQKKTTAITSSAIESMTDDRGRGEKQQQHQRYERGKFVPRGE